MKENFTFMDFKNKIFPKINLIHISILLLIIIISIFTYYQYNSTIPKRVNVKGKMEELLDDKFDVEKISKNKNIIKCQIDKRYFKEEEYDNYVLGKGKGIKINFNILLEKDGKYYKLKTLFDNESNGKFNLISCVDNKYLSGDYKVLLYNNDNSRIYKYIEIGDNSEK